MAAPSLSFRDILLVVRFAVEFHLRRTPPPNLIIIPGHSAGVEICCRAPPAENPTLNPCIIPGHLLVTRFAVELHLRRTPPPKSLRYGKHKWHGDLMLSSTSEDSMLSFWDLIRVSGRRHSISIQKVTQGLYNRNCSIVTILTKTEIQLRYIRNTQGNMIIPVFYGTIEMLGLHFKGEHLH